MKTKHLAGLMMVILLGLVYSCKKDWLDAKNDISLVVPSSLSDMRLLLNDDFTMNSMNCSDLEVSADNYDVTTAAWKSSGQTNQLESTWQNGMFAGLTNLSQWNRTYKQVFTANIILEGLAAIKPDQSTQKEWNDIKGGALFHRANAFYTLLQLFAGPYNSKTSSTAPGIPIRIKSDVTIPSTRGTIQQSYDQVISDLKAAIPLLKVTPTYKEDGSVPGAEGLLARVYLAMGNYALAHQYADACIQAYPTLIDYNTLNVAAGHPFSLFNDETIFYCLTGTSTLLTTGYVDTTLYQSYDANDLRKIAFFNSKGNGTFSFKGSYTGATTTFCGIATDEMYLTRAECSARTNDLTAAMADLNTLLRTRYKTGTFTDLTASTSDQALSLILNERRKELLFRCIRWQDLRRLNLDPNRALTITRNVNDQSFSLPPNDPKYTLPIPDYVIQQTGIQQNLR